MERPNGIQTESRVVPITDLTKSVEGPQKHRMTIAAAVGYWHLQEQEPYLQSSEQIELVRGIAPSVVGVECYPKQWNTS